MNRGIARRPGASQATSAKGVDALLANLDHPHKDGIELLRRRIVALDRRITEDVKWNAPSFKLDDHFATFKLYPATQIQLVLHTGAKPLPVARQFTLDVSALKITWPSPDRCVIHLASAADAQLLQDHVVDAVRQWVAQLDQRA